MKRFTVVAAILVMTCCVPTAGWARMAYVTDSFRISLRTGPSLENKILKFLDSGDAIEVLDSQEGWDQVEVLGPEPEGIKGWVLSRYVMERVPWEHQAKALSEENAEVKERLAGAEDELAQTKGHEKELRRRLQETMETLSRVQKEYGELRKNAPNYLKLKVAYDSGQKRIEQLTKENEQLKSSQTNRWFALGALVLLCGLMIGLIIGRQQKKRRSLLYS